MSSPSVARRSDHPQSAVAHRRSARWRWGAVLVAVVCTHWIAAQWFERHRDTFKPADAQHAPVQVTLLKPERIERKPAGAPARPQTAAVQTPRPHPPRDHVLTAIKPAQVPAPAPAASAAAAADVAAEAAADAASAAAASATAQANASATATANSPGSADNNAASEAKATPGIKFSVPPSGDLQYDTFYNGVRNQPGTIHWASDGQSYQIVVSVPLPFIGTFSYASHGRIDAFGLAPDQYIEKRGRRGEDVTVFNRVTKQIAFTRTPATLALPDGAQDRFSMIMQLASLVRGDPDAYQPGVTRQFYVTDNDSGEIWPIETIGDEAVRMEQGFIDARHFMRLPRHAGDRRRIDVWLAPSLGWLPVRLVQTEPNGTQVELVWRGKLAAPQAGDASATSATSATGGALDNPNAPNAPNPPATPLAAPSVTDPAGAAEKP